MIIILYVMDSLRPDFLTCYGYKKNTSPTIDWLAKQSTIFVNGFSQSTWTRPSGASILSSCYPSVHGALTQRDVVHPAVPFLSEDLKSLGFRTIAISSIGNISPYYGFDKGFDSFIELYKKESVTEKRVKVKCTARQKKTSLWGYAEEGIPIPTSKDINEFLIPIIRDIRHDEKLFVLAWSIDTHDPYFHRDPSVHKFCDPRENVWSSKEILEMRSEEEILYLKQLYEDMIYFNDYCLAQLMEELINLKLFDESMIILTSDHGECFGEHGTNSHGGAPYDELIRVPLIIKFPNGQYCGKFFHFAEHIDIVPTILGFLKKGEKNGVRQGRTLIPVLEGYEDGSETVYSETQLSEALPKYVALRTKSYKFIQVKRGRMTMRNLIKRDCWPLIWLISSGDMLFNLENDPSERVNLAKKEKVKLRALKGRLEEFARRNRALANRIRKYKVRNEGEDVVVKRQLRGFGYFED